MGRLGGLVGNALRDYNPIGEHAWDDAPDLLQLYPQRDVIEALPMGNDFQMLAIEGGGRRMLRPVKAGSLTGTYITNVI